MNRETTKIIFLTVERFKKSEHGLSEPVGCEGDNVLERMNATEWLRLERQKSRKG